MPLLVLKFIIKVIDFQPDILIILNYTKLLLLSLFTILDFVMFALFMGLIRFFSEKKKEMIALHGSYSTNSSKNDVKLSRFNRFIITVSIILALLNMEDQISQVIFCIMSISSPTEIKWDWSAPDHYQKFLIVAVIDFVTACALLYLFYSQGMKLVRGSKELSP